MRAVRVYQPGNYTTGQRVELSPEAGQHVGVVLRMQAGDNLSLFCGDNREFEAVIETVKKKQVIVVIGSINDVSRESPLNIHLAQAISKGDRMELVMQKAVELGVTSISPIITERCVVKLDNERMTRKRHQWQALVIAACEQSGRNTVPVVNSPMSLSRFMDEVQPGLRFILHPGKQQTWRDYTIAAANITLLIGPEGGLSEHEVQYAMAQGFQPLSLGPRILRTETAAITALSVLQAVGGDL